MLNVTKTGNINDFTYSKVDSTYIYDNYVITNTEDIEE